jgi:hypothetical protein
LKIDLRIFLDIVLSLKLFDSLIKPI